LIFSDVLSDAMRIDALRPTLEFNKHMDNWIQALRNIESINEQGAIQGPVDQERPITIER